MTRAVTVGVVLAVGLIAVVAVVLLRGSEFRDSAIPAAIGLPNGEENGARDDGSHVTNHPVLVSPKDADGGRGLREASPARGSAEPERSPAALDNSTFPDSFAPPSALRPTPKSHDPGGIGSSFESGLDWPDGRAPVAPRIEGLRPTTPELPGAGRHSVSEVPSDRLNIHLPPIRQR